MYTLHKSLHPHTSSSCLRYWITVLVHLDQFMGGAPLQSLVVELDLFLFLFFDEVEEVFHRVVDGPAVEADFPRANLEARVPPTVRR